MKDEKPKSCPTCLDNLETPQNLCNKDLKELMDLLIFLMGYQVV